MATYLAFANPEQLIVVEQYPIHSEVSPFVAEKLGGLDEPTPVMNCPNCTLWLPPGTLVCPECHGIVYGEYLRGLAEAASDEEQASNWAVAREIWCRALRWLPSGTTQAQAVQSRIDQIDGRLRSVTARKDRWTRRLGPFAPVMFFLLKAKTILLALLKLKFLLSFLAFFGLYWALFGWRFGLGFTLAILIHELGHYVAARRRGLKVDLPLFIPGLGAYVRWYNQGVNVETISAIALSGPLFGLFAGLLCLLLALKTTAGLFLALAHTTAFLNALNLIPVLGLDGAQATYALNRLQRILIALTSILLYVILREWVFLAVGAGMAWRAFSRDAPEEPSSRGMVAYLLLLVALGVVMWAAPDASRSAYGMYPR